MAESAATKQDRQSALRHLLRSEELLAQSEIVSRMKENGFAVTQPSVSRDLKEIGAVKVAGRYLAASDLPAPGRMLTREISSAGPHLIVIRTSTGAAQAVAAQIDELELPGLAGSVAGDDTIMLALNDPEQQEQILNSLRNTL